MCTVYACPFPCSGNVCSTFKPFVFFSQINEFKKIQRCCVFHFFWNPLYANVMLTRLISLDNKMDWSTNTEAVCKKGLSRLYFLRRLGSVDVCNGMLQMCHQSVAASTVFFASVAGIECGHQGKGLQTVWTNSSKRLNLLLAPSLSPWGMWWRRGGWRNCWQSWTNPPTPSTQHRTSQRAASATDSFNHAALRNDIENRSSPLL